MEDVKEYLHQLRRLDIKIEQLKDQQSMLWATLLSATNPGEERVSGGALPGDESMVNLVSKLERQSRELDRLIAEYMSLRLQIIREIQSLENPLYMQILFKRYVEYKRLDQIADELHYHYNYVCGLHGQALLRFKHLKQS